MSNGPRTRVVTDIMRAIARHSPRALMEAGTYATVTLNRGKHYDGAPYRDYWLNFSDYSTFSAGYIRYEATTHSVWIARALWDEARFNLGFRRPDHDIFDAIRAETGYIDALLMMPDITLAPCSETMESLTEWRTNRAHA